MSYFDLVIAFVPQLALILLAAQRFGYLARFIGQPKVVGEMIAGVVLGPSLFGLFWPELQQSIFIADTMPILYFGAQLGVGLYMFLVGLEFNTQLFKTNARSDCDHRISDAGGQSGDWWDVVRLDDVNSGAALVTATG